MKWGPSPFLLFLFFGWAVCAVAQPPDYRLVTDPQESAQPSALRLLKLLAEGNIEAAAKMSNAPERRYEVLREYRDAVGEAQFRALYGRYFNPANRIVAEAAIGERRLVIWDLGEEGHELAGQFFVQADGGFVLDDVPNDERARLARVLRQYRSQKKSR